MFETGVGIRNPLFFIGVVENGLDPRHENRIQVRAFGIHGTIDQIPTEDLPWAIVVAGNYHMNSLPQENHWVLGMFLDGRDAQQPLILGTIPTFMSTVVKPQIDGYGTLPKTTEQQVINGGNPENVGIPPMNRLASGEYPEETSVLEQEMNRVKDVRVAQDPNNPNENYSSWSENSSAYGAKYGFNRVYDSPDGKTTIELDSSSGAERLMIFHRGSYIQVDSNGTRTDKSYGDHQEINDHNNMIYVGGRSSVTIMGDSYVYVDGNKIEEINGDLIQVVHGNHILGVGGQSTINASDEVQIRGAQLRLESNVTGINLKAAKGLFVETGESMHFKSGIAIFQEATNSFNMKAGDNIFIQCDSKLNLKAENAAIEAAETADVKGKTVRIGGGTRVDIDAVDVKIDDTISMANNEAVPPNGASEATEADPSKTVEAPEPPAKSTSSTAKSRNKPNVGTAGVASVDDSTEGGSTSGSEAALGENTQQTNFIASNLEGKAGTEEYLGRTMSDEEYSALVAAVFAESGRNQTEQAWIAATILNRARSTNSTIIDVLNAPGQFTAVTGTSVNPKPSYWYANGPDKAIEQSINGSLKGILYTIPKNNYYFNAASQSAVQAGERYVTERSGVQATLVGQSFVYPGARWP